LLVGKILSTELVPVNNYLLTDLFSLLQRRMALTWYPPDM
jgi:hypothetical protein